MFSYLKSPQSVWWLVFNGPRQPNSSFRDALYFFIFCHSFSIFSEGPPKSEKGVPANQIFHLGTHFFKNVCHNFSIFSEGPPKSEKGVPANQKFRFWGRTLFLIFCHSFSIFSEGPPKSDAHHPARHRRCVPARPQAIWSCYLYSLAILWICFKGADTQSWPLGPDSWPLGFVTRSPKC